MDSKPSKPMPALMLMSLFINLYRYRHQSTEVWQDNCLRSIDSVTDANGKPFLVEGNLVAGQAKDNYFQVNTAGTETELPPCVMTFAYWNPANIP